LGYIHSAGIFAALGDLDSKNNRKVSGGNKAVLRACSGMFSPKIGSGEPEGFKKLFGLHLMPI
jgi:hypothetical protein